MRTRQSLLNFATMIVFTVVTMAVGLFASPWLEHWLGPKRFGACRVLTDCYGYLALMELGLGGALGPLLARAIGQGDDLALRRTVATGSRAYLRVSLLTVALGLALTPVVPWFVSGLPAADLGDLRLAWLAGSLSLVLMPLRALAEARQRGYVVNLLLTGQSLLITGAALVLACSGWGITGQALAVVLGSWVFGLSLAVGALRREPGLLRSACATQADSLTARAIRGLGVPTLLLALSGRVGLMTDNLVVGGLLGAGTLTTLFFTQRLAALAQTVLQSVGNATWAALGELHARGERETLNRRLVELSGLVALLSASVLGPIVAYNRHFVALWMGPDFRYGGDAVIALAAVNAVLVAQTSLWMWCFSTTGQVRLVLAPALVSSAVNLAASILLTRPLGPVGPLAGTTLALSAVTVWYLPLLLLRVYGTDMSALAGAVLPPLAGGLLYVTALWWFARAHRPPGWPGLAAEMSLAALGFLAVGGRLFVSADHRALWRARLRGLRPATLCAASQD
jgi:MATE family multidrug resistance protein